MTNIKSIVLLFISTIVMGGCTSQLELDKLKADIETLKNGNPSIQQPSIQQPSVPGPVSLPQSPAPTIIYTPNPNTNNVSPAPVNPKPKYGPGNANHVNSYPDGYLTIQTSSANGKLCLRSNASQSSNCLVEIPNGTSGIYYSNRVQVGDYVWYQTTFGSFTGYLRGDYVFI